MRQHKCPACGSPLSYWRMRLRAERSGRLQTTATEYSCPSCGAAIYWSLGNWYWLCLAVSASALALWKFGPFSEGRAVDSMRWLTYACIGAAAINAGIAEFTRRPSI